MDTIDRLAATRFNPAIRATPVRPTALLVARSLDLALDSAGNIVLVRSASGATGSDMALARVGRLLGASQRVMPRTSAAHRVSVLG
jgi:hypothetical protein